MNHVNKKALVLVIFLLAYLFIFADISNAYDVKVQKNILVLHSYNEEQDWTRDLTSGIVDTIRRANENYFVSVEYMDWKNYPNEANAEFLYDYYLYKYQSKQIDIIIACDDKALSFALENRKYLFSDAPVVFCGVNKESLITIDTGNYSNYTGVYEVADPTESVKLAASINPSLDKIYLATDNTESGISTAKLFVDKIEALNMELEVIPLNHLEFHDLLYVLSRLDNRSIVLYATYNCDAKGNILEYNIALKQICENSAAPVYHQYDFGLRDGIFGGNLTSPKLYGEYAADMAIDILKGKSADGIEILTPDVAKKVVDYKQFEKFNISTEDIPKDVLIVNRPFSFHETYRTLVIVVFLIFVFLISLILVLGVYNKRISRMKQELAVKNNDLVIINAELVESDRALKSQYEELCTMQEDLRNSEEKYTYLALHDMLTDLPNRRSLLLDATRHFSIASDRMSALLFLDMDNFKYINDTMGHGFGDELIKKVGERLNKSTRGKGILYRLGGDEFIIFLPQIENGGEVESFVRKIMRTFKKGFSLKNSTLRISGSIGVAIYPVHGDNFQQLIKSADIAMYKAKELGRNRYVLYESSMDEAFADRMALEKHLHSAMQNNEFEIYYQPQFNTESGRITGMEALLRWTNPELGRVPPLRFIPVAEDTHLIIPLGEWVLRQACGFLSELHQNGYSELTVSVNISTIQTMQSDFPDKVIKILEQYELDPKYLELEITETVLIESFDAVLDKLQLLNERGIHIALDDFGKGYSSLSYLMRLPISTLKIDKSFIDNISINSGYKEITSHIISLGKSLGVSIVAEGVEQEQLSYLKKYKCDRIQGYLFSKPVSGNDFKTLIGL